MKMEELTLSPPDTYTYSQTPGSGLKNFQPLGGDKSETTDVDKGQSVVVLCQAFSDTCANGSCESSIIL
jgi:hypothetical protein